MPTETVVGTEKKSSIAGAGEAGQNKSPNSARGLHSIFDACIPGAVPLEMRESEGRAGEPSGSKATG